MAAEGGDTALDTTQRRVSAAAVLATAALTVAAAGCGGGGGSGSSKSASSDAGACSALKSLNASLAQLKKADLTNATTVQPLVQNARIAWQKYSAQLPDDAQAGVTQVNEGMRQLRLATAPVTNAAAAGKSAKAALTPATQQEIKAAEAQIAAGIKQTAGTLDC